MTLSKDDLLKRCVKEHLIEPYTMESIQACSYDLTFSGEYYYHHPEDGNEVKIRTLPKGGKLKIPKDAICYVLTTETISMPNDLTASLSLAFSLIKEGIMLAAQPPYDPGYEGKTVALLHNLSDDVVFLQKGQHILSIVFNLLSSPIQDADRYQGNYQGLDSLKQYCTEVKRGGVFVLAQKFDTWREKFQRAVPTLLTILTLIIGILTVIFPVGAAIITYEREAASDIQKLDQGPRIFVESADNFILYVNQRAYRIRRKDESNVSIEELLLASGDCSIVR